MGMILKWVFKKQAPTEDRRGKLCESDYLEDLEINGDDIKVGLQEIGTHGG